MVGKTNASTGGGLQLEYDGFKIETKSEQFNNTELVQRAAQNFYLMPLSINVPNTNKIVTIHSGKQSGYLRENGSPYTNYYGIVYDKVTKKHTWITQNMEQTGLFAYQSKSMRRSSAFFSNGHMYPMKPSGRFCANVYDYTVLPQLQAIDVNTFIPYGVMYKTVNGNYSNVYQSKFGAVYKPENDTFYILLNDGLYEFDTFNRLTRIKAFTVSGNVPYSNVWIGNTLYGLKATSDTSSYLISTNVDTGATATKRTGLTTEVYMDYYYFQDKETGYELSYYDQKLAYKYSTRYILTKYIYNTKTNGVTTIKKDIDHSEKSLAASDKCSLLEPNIKGFGGEATILEEVPVTYQKTEYLNLKQYSIDTTANVMNITGTGEVKYQFSDEAQATKVTLPATIKNPTLSLALKIKGIEGKNVAFTKL